MRKRVSVVIPVLNEAGNVSVIAELLHREFEKTAYDYEVIFVDDGSTDDTLSELSKLAEKCSNIYFISFSRNFGHQNALKAGLDHATGECVISMDGDLQHPPELISKFLQQWENGYQIVYSLRDDDLTGSWFKLATGWMFYKALNAMSEVEIERGAADFRLLDRVVVDQLKAFPEMEPFYRGLVKWVGFRQIAIHYKPAPRRSGKTKYSLNKMIQLALSGVTSFNTRPLVSSITLGVCFSVLSIVVYLPYMIYMLSARNHFPRWASLITAVVFFGGLNLIILGVIGLYVGKLFLQSKARPHYIIQKSKLG